MRDDRLVSVKELAAYLQVDISTVYLWSQLGQIPATLVSKMWRDCRSEIEEWLNLRRSQPLEREGVTRGTD